MQKPDKAVQRDDDDLGRRIDQYHNDDGEQKYQKGVIYKNYSIQQLTLINRLKYKKQ